MDQSPPVPNKPEATFPALPSEPAGGSVASSRSAAEGAPSEGMVFPADYELQLFRQRFNRAVQHRDADALTPIRGIGYPTLYALVHLNERYRPSPVAGIHAFCGTPTRCEYLPPRKADFPESFTISLSDDSFARLSAMDDLVAISTPHLDVATPVTVIVTLTIPGQPPISRKITYAAIDR